MHIKNVTTLYKETNADNLYSYLTPGKRVQIIFDNTSPSQVILGIVTDILNQNAHLKIEACMQFGEPMLGLFLDRPSVDYPRYNPQATRHLHSTPKIPQITEASGLQHQNMPALTMSPCVTHTSSTNQTPTMIPQSQAIHQLGQRGTKRGLPSSFAQSIDMHINLDAFNGSGSYDNTSINDKRSQVTTIAGHEKQDGNVVSSGLDGRGPPVG